MTVAAGTWRRALGTLVALAAAAALAGCGLGPGEGVEDVSLRVTRDFGARTVVAVEAGPMAGSETVMRYLQRHAQVRTRYGGGYVQAIDGLAGEAGGARPLDWFFYVNGIEASEGAAATRLRAGDRVWWDRHAWDGAQRSAAVVGSYPEPFAHGYGGRRRPARVSCAADTAPATCDAVRERLAADGAELADGADDADALRVLVGSWPALRSDRAARLLGRGAQASGVFARFVDGGRGLELLDDRGEPARSAGAGAGLIAATRLGDRPPTWLVTGTDAAGVAAAADALGADALADRFALALVDGDDVALPVARP